MGRFSSLFSSISSILQVLIECQLCKIAMETQVEFLKSTGGIVQHSQVQGHFNEQKGSILVQPSPGWADACIQPKQQKGETDGGKFVKLMIIWLFVPGGVMLGSQGRGVRSQGFDFCGNEELSSVTAQ